MKCYFCSSEVDEEITEKTKAQFGQPICFSCLLKWVELQAYTRGAQRWRGDVHE